MQFHARFAPGLATVILALWSCSLEAQIRQQEALEDPRYAGWVFTPSFATGGTWDDNLLLLHGDDPAIEDYATPINPSLLLEYRGRQTMLATSYDSSFLVYRDLRELNSSQQGFSAKLHHRVSPRFNLTAEESFVKAPTTDVITLGNVPFFHIGTRSNAAGAGIEATVARGTIVRLTYTRSDVAFERDPELTRQLQGGHSHDGLLAFSRALSPRLTVGAQYELRRAVVAGQATILSVPGTTTSSPIDGPIQPVLIPGDDQFTIQSGAVTGEYKFTQLTSVSGFAGVARLGAGIQHAGRTGPAIGVTIMRRARLGAISAGYQRAFIPSWAFGGTSQNEEWHASVHVPFARNRAYLRTRTALLDADSLVPGQPSLRSLWMGGTLGYRATRWLNLEAFYSGTGQDSNQAGGNRRRNVLGFRIVTAKPMKIG